MIDLLMCLVQLCPTAGRMRPSRRFCAASYVFALVKVTYILTTCCYFDNFENDIFGAEVLQCHFITFVIIAVRIRTLSAY